MLTWSEAALKKRSEMWLRSSALNQLPRCFMATRRCGGPNQHYHSQLSFEAMTLLQPQQRAPETLVRCTNAHFVSNRGRLEQE
jgi:hypothetical protein